jgi:uncharacterized membrane protein
MATTTLPQKVPTSGGPHARPGRKNPAAKIVVPSNRGIKVVSAITIRRPTAEIYAFWRDLSNLPQIVKHPIAIATISQMESHWSVSAPGDRTVEWDALIINDHPDQLIAWRSRDGADVPNAGSVRFEPAPDGDGTVVTVALEYDPPGGKLGAFIAKLTRDSAEAQVRDALRRLKALMENT